MATHSLKYWRIRTVTFLYLGYVSYLLTRKSFAYAMPAMMADLGIPKADLGTISSFAALVYGVSKLLGGIMCDLTNPRHLFAIGLAGTGLFNVWFSFGHALPLFTFTWAANMWWQGWGWPAITTIIRNWFSPTERALWWGVACTAGNVGTGLSPFVVTHLAVMYDWRVALQAVGLWSMLAGLLLFVGPASCPAEVDLTLPPEKEKPKKEVMANSLSPNLIQKQVTHTPPSPDKAVANTTPAPRTVSQRFWEDAVGNPYVWLVSISNVNIYFIRQVFHDWCTVMLIETHGLSMTTAGSLSAWFEVGGFVGTLVAGWASDRDNGRRGPVNTVYSALLTLCMFLPLQFSSAEGISASLFVVGFLVGGPQMLLGVFACEVGESSSSGTITGWTQALAQFGCSLAGFPIAALASEYGWNAVFLACSVSALLSCLFVLPLWNATAPPPKKPSKGEKVE